MQKLKLEELNRVSPEEFKRQEKTPIIIVLDNVRSMHNIGSIFRTSDAFAFQSIYLCGITAQPPHREIEKTALGATQSMEWHYREETKGAVEELKGLGYRVIAIEQAQGSMMLQDFKPKVDDKYALVFGNEVNGVGEEVMEMVDGCIEIPQFGTKHSFNIVVSMGIVGWDFISKIKGQGSGFIG